MSEEREASGVVFDEERAARYDERFAKLAPMKDALHLTMRTVLAELPDDAHVLCVGAGTGAELLYLAEAFAGWRFTAVDPAGAMLSVCRRRAAEAGVDGRCKFHEGTLDTLPETEPFDAATSILVSHFLTDEDARVAFFRGIAERLKPGGWLVSADLASTAEPQTYERLYAPWAEALRYTGMDEDEVTQYRANLDENVAVCAPEQIEGLLATAGFETPVRFFQTLLIHAWFARRGA